MRVAARLDARDVARRLDRLRRRTPVVTAQELNTQRRQSRGRIAKAVATVLNVTPVKRIRSRIKLPRGGAATPKRLRAVGLVLTAYLPSSWFVKGVRGRGGGATVALPPLTSVVPGRGTTGGYFSAKMPSGHKALFRRAQVPRTRENRDGKRTWLPIKEQVIDANTPMVAARYAILVQLAREWPARWERRMAREIKRTF